MQPMHMQEKKYNVKVRDPLFYRENVPCMEACPVHTDAGKYVELVSQGRFKEAYLVARSPNPMASVCGRICSAPCEDVCTRGNYDRPVTIRALKRFLTEKYGSESKNTIPLDEFVKSYENLASIKLWDIHNTVKLKTDNNKEFKVAVIGAGPAGVACAHDLALMGYSVTVFEAQEHPGGMLQSAVPDYRLPNAVLFRETFSLSEQGVELIFNRPIAGDFGLSQLKSMGFGALFIAAGAGLGRGLNIEGANFNGVYKALDFLFQVNKGKYVNLGKKVVVIGGGLVAIDAARTALRDILVKEGERTVDESMVQQVDGMLAAVDAARSAARVGAVDITVAALESEAELPSAQSVSGREELEDAEREGIKFVLSRGPKRFIGDDNRVTGVELIRVKSVFDENGRFNPTFAEGTEEVVEADSVILAIGQTPDLNFIKEEDGIELTPYGTIKTDVNTLQTTAEGIYAGGDAVFGPRIVIEAVENGKRAAASIHEFFQEKKSRVHYSVSVEELSPESYYRETGYEKIPRCEPGKVPDAQRIGFKELEITFNEDEAVEQAKRCLQCRTTPVYEQEICILCGFCAEICPEDVLKFVPSQAVAFIDEEESVLLKELEGEGTAFIKDESRCIRCGLCAHKCPTGAIRMERFSFKEDRA
ncbi:MAG: FAD-dependent oxidoreductase [bacterium]|nr:FAD-dependent oxidoreductase [bacterium]